MLNLLIWPRQSGKITMRRTIADLPLDSIPNDATRMVFAASINWTTIFPKEQTIRFLSVENRWEVFAEWDENVKLTAGALFEHNDEWAVSRLTRETYELATVLEWLQNPNGIT